MEKVERNQEFCTFCLKSIEEFTNSKDYSDISKFYTMLERHLKSDIRIRQDEEDSSRNGFLLGGRCCEDCFRIGDSFCDLYCQMKNLKLKINWRIWSLTNIMSSADKVGSRVERFRNSFIKEGSGVGGETCFEDMWKSRKDLINSCERKLRHSYPKLNVTKCDKTQPISSPSSPIDFTPDTTQVLNVSSFRDGETNCSGNVTVLPVPLEQRSIERAEDNLDNLKIETETTTIQSASSVADNLVSYTTLVKQRGKKKMRQSHLKRTGSSQKQSDLVKKSYTDEDKNSSNKFDTNVISDPIIALPCGDTNDSENCSISNLKQLTHPINTEEKEDLSETTYMELEADGVDVSRVEFEFKFDTTPADELNGLSPCETTPEPIIESTPVVLAVVDDTKHESTSCSLALPISNDMVCHTNEESISSESPCAINSSTINPTAYNRFPDTKWAHQSSEISSLEHNIPSSTPPEETTVTRRLRTVYKCSQCCQTFSTQEKQLVHQKYHLQHEDNVDDMSAGGSDEDASEGDFDLDIEQDSDSSSSINDHQDEAEDRESPNPSVGVAPPPMDEVARKESGLSKLKVNLIKKKPVLSKRRYSRRKKTTYTRKRKRFSAVFIPPKKVITNGGSSTYECECGEKFSSIVGYRRHRKIMHGTIISQNANSDLGVPAKTIMELLLPKYPCSEANCSEVFVLEEELENHKKHHGTFHCQGCPKIQYFAQDLSVHEAKHSSKNSTGKSSEKKLWHCFRCKFFCKRKSSYLLHHVKNHLKLPSALYLCPICRKSFHSSGDNRQSSLNKHFKQCHDVSTMKPESVPKCSKCSAYFRTKLQLQTHINVVCKNKCSDCGRTFPNRQQFRSHRLKNHIKMTTPFPHKCKDEDCGKSFETEVDLEWHTKIQHPPGWNSQVQCDICGKEVFRINLTKHIYHVHKRVTQEKSGKICEKCGKSFPDKNALKLHYLSHAKPESWKFSCSICGRKCSTKQKLEFHERTHTKEKPFVCQVCGVSYAHRHNLRIHVNNKHSDVFQDIPKRVNTTNMVSRKGIKCKAVFEKINDSIEVTDSD